MAAESGVKKGAGLVIIGDELLKGRVQDANSVYLTRELWKLGIRTRKIVVVQDDVEEIARYVREFSNQFQYVITTGGVGPTHDDVTFEGVARGMGRELQTNKEVSEYLRKVGFDEGAIEESRMNKVPKDAEVSFGANKILSRWFPLIKVENVFVLPGIPSYTKTIFQECSNYFEGANEKFFSEEIYYQLDESVFAKGLEEIQKKYGKNVEIGSYPASNESYKTKITMDAVDQKVLQNCFLDVKNTLFPKFQTEISSPQTESKRAEIKKKEQSLLEGSADFESRLEEAMSVIDKVLIMYSYSEVCLAFNGGKDCTVLLELVKRALNHPRRGIENLSKILLLYIKTGESFIEIEEFVEKTSKENKQKVVRMEGGLKESLSGFRTQFPSVKAVLMGTRNADPNSEQLHFLQTTDSDWPNFMRVMPILSWTYSDVWKLIWEGSVPYCALYDQGYTSLGDARSTVRNPALKLPGGRDEYQPAYLLRDPKKERDGRASSVDSQ